MVDSEVASATAHYLHMIDPARELRAIAYTHGSHWLMLWGWIVLVSTDLLILRMRFIVALRDRIQRIRPRPNLIAFACAGTFFLAAWLLRLPWAIYTDWIRERSYGLTSQGLATWFGQSMITILFSSVLLGLLAVALYSLMRATGRRWWAWSGGIIILFSFFAIAVAPVALGLIFDTARAAPAGAVRDSVEMLARRAGIPADRIVVVDGSKQSNRYSATVAGGPGFATIQLSDTMLQGNPDITQVRAVVAHEIGHYRHNHLLLLSIAVGVLITIGLWVVESTLGGEALAGRREPLVQDPGAIPALHIVLSTFMLLTTPIITSVQRWVEQDADAYGLALANEPDGAAKALLQTVDYRASSPGPLEEALFYEHPSIANRIRAAMEWKAAHRGPNGSARASTEAARGP